MMFKPILQFVRKSLHRHVDELREEALLIEKLGAGLTDNMRALRLVATISDQLLSRGMAASDVVYLALGITSTYCSRKVHIDISHTILTLSQDRGIDREPLTLVRTISHKGTDYHTVQLLEELSQEIKDGHVPLDQAEHRLDKIVAQARLRKPWVVHASAGGVSAGVVMLYSDNPVVWFIAMTMGTLINIVLYRLAKLGMPSFYAQAVAGLIITLIAACASLFAASEAVPFLSEVHPTLIIIAGVVLLVAGMMIVGAFQDAIDEYYLTAAARLLKVAMMTGGIVLGVTIGLYFATRMGVQLAATPERLSLADLNYQYIGAAILAASFALGNHTRIISVIAAGLVGFLSLYTVLVLTSVGIGVIPASGIAAAIVGLSATVLLRLFHIPTIAIISAGIVPLVPGLTLYGALTHIAQAAPNSPEFDMGVALLLRAVLIAVAIAAGATLGNLIGRPARRRLIHRQNRLPLRRLSLRR